MNTLSFSAAGISVSFDLSVGHVAALEIETGGRVLTPLHRAPWIDAAGVPDDIPEGQKRLSGDFLCAPFGVSDVEPAPLHGWPANSSWSVVSSAATADGWQARLRLDRTVLGATIDKVVMLRDGHPFLYQEHVVTGGAGALPVAHHAMTVMAAGGRLAFSAKRFAETPPEALEPDPARGRSRLAYPARSADLQRFPLADGSLTDLTVYEAGTSSEDFVTLVEAPRAALGWTVVARRAEADLVLVLKNPAELPVTMLWLSNGGRDYAPWSGRHAGVLGIEDGRAAMGHALSLGDNALRREGIPTAFDLGGAVAFRHVIGALPSDPAGVPPASVEPAAGRLRLAFADGHVIDAPFDAAFLACR